VGSRCQREQRKEKERGRGGPARGGLDGPTGLAGPIGEQGMVSFFFFFKLIFKTTFFFSNSNQNSFKPFLKNL
jgi:hypothetical protein